MKPALAYVQLYPTLRDEARRHGYALGIHGSLGRDLDVIAVPWTDTASPVERLVTALARAGGCYAMYKRGGRLACTKKPHGRLAFSLIPIPGDRMFVDLSVMPPRRKKR